MTDTRKTILPAIGNTRDTSPANLSRLLSQMKEHLEVLSGQRRGDATDRVVTHREIDALVTAKATTLLATTTVATAAVTTAQVLALLDKAITSEQLSDDLVTAMGLDTDVSQLAQDILDLQGAMTPLLVSIGALSPSAGQTMYFSTPTTAAIAAGVTTDGTSLTVAGDLSLSGTAKHYLGNFTDATVNNRPSFKTNVTNGATGVPVVPDGSGTGSYWLTYNSSDPANANVGFIGCNTAGMQITCNKAGTAGSLPIIFNIDSVEACRIDSTGNLAIPSGKAILGDFSNGTLTSRSVFRSSTTNGNTGIIAVPNLAGGLATAAWIVSGATDPTNATLGFFEGTTTTINIGSRKQGSGTSLPIQFDINSTVYGILSTSGLWGFGGITAPAWSSESYQTQGVTRWSTDTSAPAMIGRKARGSQASPTGVSANDVLFNFAAQGYHSSSAWGGNAAKLFAVADDTFTTTAQGAHWDMYSTTAGTTTAVLSLQVKPGSVNPGSDNALSCGTAALRWSVVYAATGTINTSDARLKTAITPLSPAELTAAKQLSAEIGTFQFLDAIAKKGAGSARHHAGLTVQRAMEIMVANGLDPLRYGFICHDTWAAQNAATEAGPVEQIPAGDRYSFRTDELLLFLARGFDARLGLLNV